jgi:16S rRNA (cytosine967-C5)-methyltransferase
MSEPLARLHPAQVRLVQAVLEEVLAEGAAADRALARRIKQRPKLGARDRRWVTGLLFGTLRRAVGLRRRAGDRPAAWLAAQLAEVHGARAEDLARLGLPTPSPALAEDDSARRNWPDWLNAAAAARMAAADCDALAAALRQEAAVDLRVNRLRGSREQARALLAEDGVSAQPLEWAPDALRLAARRPLQQTRAWRQGLIEPQDAGSQLVCELLAPVAGEAVADWCAGAGGKALAMAARQLDRGAITAFDTDAQRLGRIAERAQRLGARSIDVQAFEGESPGAVFDAVLVDAPCSGSGTLRRHPDQVLREVDLAAMAATQLEILGAAARTVRPGGRLVYATCSFLPQENDDVVANFLQAQPDFRMVPAGSVLGCPPADAGDPWLRTRPDIHGCDAFCALRLQRGG